MSIGPSRRIGSIFSHASLRCVLSFAFAASVAKTAPCFAA